MNSSYPGARWWKVDFHTHTPHSTDTPWHSRDSAPEPMTAEQWLRRFMDAGVDCVAVTDHNGGGWIDPLKAAYEAMRARSEPTFRELHIFPGVELSVSGGIHLLVIFETRATSDDVVRFLARVDCKAPPGDPGDCSSLALVAVLKETKAQGLLAIPAHADGPKGLLQVNPGTRESVIDSLALGQASDSTSLFSAEWVQSRPVTPQSYESRGLAWTSVLGTDNHGKSEDSAPGSRYTWIKMGTPSLEGLRLALLDGAPYSVVRSDSVPVGFSVAAPVALTQEPSVVIEEVRISDAKRMGRCGEQVVRFSPWLTTFVGGRGTGKSTVIEMMRLAMQRELDLPEALRTRFRNFMQVAEGRRDLGVLCSGTKIVLVMRKNGLRQRVTCEPGQSAWAMEQQDADGTWRHIPGEPGRLPVRILSQGEVLSIAESPTELLRLIDKAADVEALVQRRLEVEARFLRIRGERRELDAALLDKPRVGQDLAEVTGRLALMEEAGNAETLRRYQRTRRQARILEEQDAALSLLEGNLREMIASIEMTDVDVSEFDSEAPGDASGLELIASARALADRLREGLARTVEPWAASRVEWDQGVEESVWTKSKAEVEQKYSSLLEKMSERDGLKPSDYVALVQRRHVLEARLRELEEFERKAKALDSSSDAQLVRLTELHQERTEARCQALERILHGNLFVGIDVVPFGDAVSAAETFRQILGKDSEFESDILSEGRDGGCLAELLGGDEIGVAREAAVAQRLKALKERLLSPAVGADSAFTAKFRKYLASLPHDRRDRLMLWWPEDGLAIQTKSENRRPRPIEQGSPGEKSATILAFLLSHGDEPLILDQPEDDLDNSLIYELIVAQLRNNKLRRQVIVATHDANIVVNGAAELVLAFAYGGGQCTIDERYSGALDNVAVRDWVCRIMEGGRVAFERRYRRLFEERDHA